jgi:ABC-type dipeptide/oligopeptide/nickel transport system ATPase subunit
MPGGSLVSARKIELKGQWGQVFGPLDLDLEKGGVTVLTAPPGAARTALMMALCGRMKINSGTLRVFDHVNDQPAVFQDSSICCFDELDGFQPSVTVQDLVTEQRRWEAHWYEWIPLATTEDVKAMCGYLFDDRPVPPIDAFMADLPELDQMLMRIGVANTRRKPLLVVGRLDHMADDEQRHALMRKLIELGKEQSIITADVNGDEFEDHECDVVDVPGLLEFQQRSSAARRIAEQQREKAESGEEDWDSEDAGSDEAPINGDPGEERDE